MLELALIFAFVENKQRIAQLGTISKFCDARKGHVSCYNHFCDISTFVIRLPVL
jgi:hypothetical protein